MQGVVYGSKHACLCCEDLVRKKKKDIRSSAHDAAPGMTAVAPWFQRSLGGDVRSSVQSVNELSHVSSSRFIWIVRLHGNTVSQLQLRQVRTLIDCCWLDTFVLYRSFLVHLASFYSS